MHTHELLGELQLSHLSETMNGQALLELVNILERSRLELLQHLRDLGIEKLAERQRLANGLGKAHREGRVGFQAPLQPIEAPRPAPLAPAKKRERKLYAVSDLHWDHEANQSWLHRIPDGSHMDDAIIVAGDITHKMDMFRDCLTCFKLKFGEVFWVAGNHDLWVCRQDVGMEFKTSVDKLEWCLQVCSELNVRTEPTRIQGSGGSVWVVPLYGWYNSDFDGQSTEESRKQCQENMSDTYLCAWPEDVRTVDEMLASRNTPVLARSFDAPVISYSHFLPRPDLMPPRARWGYRSFICDAVGSRLLEKQIRQLNSKLHIFGHTHINWDAYHDGIHYVQNAVRYPNERVYWRSRVDEIQENDISTLLVWSSDKADKFCPLPERCGKCNWPSKPRT